MDVIIQLCDQSRTGKEAVYREIVRILRPSGRIATSDIVLSEPIDSALSAGFGRVGPAVWVVQSQRPTTCE